MTILTASNQAQVQLTEAQKQAALLCGVEPERHIIVPIREDYERPPSWFKIQALIQHLPNHKSILWMDADAMTLRALPRYDLTQGLQGHTVELAKDKNGWNCGVMIWNNCPKAFEWLWRIYDSYERFAQHPWFEQAAFQTMADGIRPHELFKTWNSYEDDNILDPLILHLPAKSNDYRLRIMRERLEKMKP